MARHYVPESAVFEWISGCLFGVWEPRPKCGILACGATILVITGTERR
jgi:hypothetical protein